MKEAMYWEAASGKKVKCLLCPQGCVISDGKRGTCTARINIGGKLFSLTYGLVISGHVDPIEKKPVYHFAPGSGVYSMGTLGCTLKCLHCQNHSLSMTPPPAAWDDPPDGSGDTSGVASFLRFLKKGKGKTVTPKLAVGNALASGAKGIAWTYNEPTVWYEFMLETSRLAQEKGLYVVIVTNGYINPEPFAELAPVVDAANIDVKAFDNKFYKERCKGRLQPVLDIAVQAKKAGIHVELTTLIIPTRNDEKKKMKEEAEWIRDLLGPDTPVHLSRFRPEYKDNDLPPTPEKTVESLARTARDAGLNHVYIGNMHSDEFSDTVCPVCRRSIIKRTGFTGKVVKSALNGNCPKCSRAIFMPWN